MAKASKLIKPKWSFYDIRNHNPEHDLFESYVVEFNDISGIEICFYIRDESVEQDRLYGEATNIRYNPGRISKAVYEVTEEPTVTTGFGINSEEVIQFMEIPKFTFSRDISAGYHPKPGDAVVTSWNNRSYEIADVSEESKIFGLKKLVWSFVLRPFRFSEESQSVRDISQLTREPTDPIPDTSTTPLTAFGDNDWLEDQSDDIYDYEEEDVDTTIYGY